MSIDLPLATGAVTEEFMKHTSITNLDRDDVFWEGYWRGTKEFDPTNGVTICYCEFVIVSEDDDNGEVVPMEEIRVINETIGEDGKHLPPRLVVGEHNPFLQEQLTGDIGIYPGVTAESQLLNGCLLTFPSYGSDYTVSMDPANWPNLPSTPPDRLVRGAFEDPMGAYFPVSTAVRYCIGDFSDNPAPGPNGNGSLGPFHVTRGYSNTRLDSPVDGPSGPLCFTGGDCTSPGAEMYGLSRIVYTSQQVGSV